MQLLLLLDDGSILFIGTHHIAYFRVHSRASSLYFSRSVLYILAISGTNGSSGFGSQSREQIDNRTVKKKRRERKKKSIKFYFVSSKMFLCMVRCYNEIIYFIEYLSSMDAIDE